MAQHKRSRTQVIAIIAIWVVALTAISSVFMLLQWIAWHGPQWLMGTYAEGSVFLGVGTLLAGLTAVLGVIWIAGWAMELVNS